MAYDDALTAQTDAIRVAELMMDVAEQTKMTRAVAKARTEETKARSVVHWSPYDRVGVVNAVP